MADFYRWWDLTEIVHGVMTESELAILTGDPTGTTNWRDRR